MNRQAAEPAKREEIGVYLLEVQFFSALGVLGALAVCLC